MRIRITIITVYHSQSDDQFEHTNQIIKVVLQYILKDTSNAERDFECINQQQYCCKLDEN